MKNFEEILKKDLHQFLLSMKEVLEAAMQLKRMDYHMTKI